VFLVWFQQFGDGFADDVEASDGPEVFVVGRWVLGFPLRSGRALLVVGGVQGGEEGDDAVVVGVEGGDRVDEACGQWLVQGNGLQFLYDLGGVEGRPDECLEGGGEGGLLVVEGRGWPPCR